MLNPTLITQILRVQNIRSHNPKGFGGAIFSGQALDEQGRALASQNALVVKAPAFLLSGISVEKGQWWQVHGEAQHYQREVNGYVVYELQILPHDMYLLRPSGEHIVRLLADNPAFKGIGEVKARQL